MLTRNLTVSICCSLGAIRCSEEGSLSFIYVSHDHTSESGVHGVSRPMVVSRPAKVRGPSTWLVSQRGGEQVDKIVYGRRLTTCQQGHIVASSWPRRVASGYAGANEHRTGGVKDVLDRGCFWSRTRIFDAH